MATKLQRITRQLNDEFREKLTEAVQEKFGIEVEHEWRGLLSPDGGRLVTTRVDGADFTPEQFAFIDAYSQGYSDAMQLVRAAA